MWETKAQINGSTSGGFLEIAILGGAMDDWGVGIVKIHDWSNRGRIYFLKESGEG